MVINFSYIMRLLTFVSLLAVSLSSQCLYGLASLAFIHEANTQELSLTISGDFDPDTVTAPDGGQGTLYIAQHSNSERTATSGSGDLTFDSLSPSSSIGGRETVNSVHYLLIQFDGTFSETGLWTVTGSSFAWTTDTGQPLPVVSSGDVFWGTSGSDIGPKIGDYTLNYVPEPGIATVLIAMPVAALAWYRRRQRSTQAE